MELGKKRLIEAELVNYLTDTIFVGGDFSMEDGVTQSVETQFGIIAGFGPGDLDDNGAPESEYGVAPVTVWGALKAFF